MADQQALYKEVKPDIERVSVPLFDMSKRLLSSQGNFLPYAAVLTEESKVEFVGAMGEKDLTNAAELLPLLHSGLRAMAKRKALSAIGIAESVTITPPGRSATKAIKVLFEDRRGIAVALYMPFEKKLLKGYVYSEISSVLAKPEVKAW